MDAEAGAVDETGHKEFLGSPVFSLPGSLVQSLVEELSSCKLSGTAIKSGEKRNKMQRLAHKAVLLT